MQNSTPDNPKPRRWPRVLLAVSLALNLLFLGLFAGASFRHRSLDAVSGPPRTIGGAMFRALPSEDRRALRAGSKTSHQDRRAGQKADAKAISAALRQTPFQADALRDILAKQGAHRAGFQEAVQLAWLDRIAGMTDKARLAYADRFEKSLERRHAQRRDAN